MVNRILQKDIPDDWEVLALGDYAQILRGGSPRPIQNYITQRDDGVNWIKIGDVGADAKYIVRTEEKIIKEGVSRSRMVYKGDLILSNSMSFGRPYILGLDGCIHDGWLVIQKYSKTFDINYLYYALSSELTMQQYISMAAGSSVQNLNKEKVAKVLVPCPSMDEQKLIATYLSDVDMLLSDLQGQIAKKKDIWKGTLQALLTGKKRLTSEVTEWKKEKLGEIVSISAPMVNPREEHYWYLPHIGNESIEKHTGRLLDYNRVVDDHLVSGKYLFTETDVLYGKINPQFGKVAYPKFRGLCSADMYPLTCGNKILPEYLKYVLLSYDYLKFSVALSLRSGMPKVNRTEMLNYEFMLPAIDEQREIVNVLNDMDEEIRLLIRKKEKYQKVKQGMMEELLTGKTRLL